MWSSERSARRERGRALQHPSARKAAPSARAVEFNIPITMHFLALAVYFYSLASPCMLSVVEFVRARTKKVRVAVYSARVV